VQVSVGWKGEGAPDFLVGCWDLPMAFKYGIDKLRARKLSEQVDSGASGMVPDDSVVQMRIEDICRVKKCKFIDFGWVIHAWEFLLEGPLSFGD
jgi:hypothetical protein